MGQYFLDFYCPEAKLCVEVDGVMHLAHVERDANRDQVLLSHGIQTLRIPSDQLFDGTGAGRENAILAILSACENRSGRPGNRDIPWLFD